MVDMIKTASTLLIVNRKEVIMRNAFLILGVVTLVAGCGSDMRAVSSNGETAKFRYEQGLSSDSYYATIGS